ncbi:MAG: cytochrome c oxidase subunit 3 [Pseudomonadota bacterium]
MAGAKNHQYHILPPSFWPLLGSIAGLTLAFGMVMVMHKFGGAQWVFLAGLALVILTMFSWWSDVIREAHAGDHTPIVQLHLRYGMILFIASEVMFFVGWFWAWFDFSLFPSTVDVVGGQWPPKGMEVINAFEFPLLNTLILLCSGTTLTWSHHALIHGDRKNAINGLWLTIILGLIFSSIQAYEYVHAPFAFRASGIPFFGGEGEMPGTSYGGAFFMATGFHGFHVIVGTIFLIVNLVRLYRGDFTPRQHFGFEAAAWYWHFVDVVWLFLFVSIYVWGGWGAPVHAG